MKKILILSVIVLSGCGIPSEDYQDMKNYCKYRYSEHFYDTCMDRLEKQYDDVTEVREYVKKKGWYATR